MVPLPSSFPISFQNINFLTTPSWAGVCVCVPSSCLSPPCPRSSGPNHFSVTWTCPSSRAHSCMGLQIYLVATHFQPAPPCLPSGRFYISGPPFSLPTFIFKLSLHSLPAPTILGPLWNSLVLPHFALFSDSLAHMISSSTHPQRAGSVDLAAPSSAQRGQGSRKR